MEDQALSIAAAMTEKDLTRLIGKMQHILSAKISRRNAQITRKYLKIHLDKRPNHA